MTRPLTELSEKNPDKVFLFTVGGCGEFGMNLTIYAYRGHCYIVDCGLAFAEPYEIGIDAHIPNPEELEQIMGAPPTAYLITHGHEDHIGALPYFLAYWPAPVYIGPWALALVKEKLAQLRDNYNYDFHEVLAGQTIRTGNVSVHWVHVPHSIPHCCSLLIDADGQRVFHTGDFKLKGFLPFETDLDLDNLSRIRAQGEILAFVSDSTNASAPGECPHESVVISSLTKVIGESKGVSFVTTFSSNLWRLKTVLDIACQLNKKVFIMGMGMRRCLEIAAKLNLLGDEIRALTDEDGLRRLARKDLIVMSSGCQGEYKSGLKRLIHGEVSYLGVQADDRVIFSSRVIPGNEKAIAKLVSICHEKGALVVTAREYPDIHVSGHAYAGDLAAVMDRLKPNYAVPVHGTFTQIRANQKLTSDPGKVVDVRNGQITALSKDGPEVVSSFDLSLLFIDSWSRQPMTYDTMRSRHKIGDSGLAVVSGAIMGPKMKFEVEFIGLPFSGDDDAEDYELKVISGLKNLHRQMKGGKNLSTEGFNDQARMMIRRILSDRFVKKPVVISKIFLGDEA